MALPPILMQNLRLPVVASPLFIISHPALTLAQCKAGIIGAFPALGACVGVGYFFGNLAPHLCGSL